MSKLIEQLQRLYAPATCVSSEDPGAPLALCGSDGKVRTLVVGILRGGDWGAVAALYEGLQADLELPAPAISVSPTAGFQVWLSLAEPVAAAQAAAFLQALRRRYLAELPAGRLTLQPLAGEAAGRVARVPAPDPASGKWSAFIDPSMGSMFADGPGLEIAPNPDRQADMLAGVRSIAAKDFQRAFELLTSADAAGDDAAPGAAASGQGPLAAAGRARSTLTVGGNFTDPKAFLLAVMNDPSASAKDRIRAARALLPYCAARPPQ